MADLTIDRAAMVRLRNALNTALDQELSIPVTPYMSRQVDMFDNAADADTQNGAACRLLGHVSWLIKLAKAEESA